MLLDFYSIFYLVTTGHISDSEAECCLHDCTGTACYFEWTIGELNSQIEDSDMAEA